MGMWALWAATEVEPHAINISTTASAIRRPEGPRSPTPRSRRCAAPFAVLDDALAKDG